jgi:hypothetical protein
VQAQVKDRGVVQQRRHEHQLIDCTCSVDHGDAWVLRACRNRRAVSQPVSMQESQYMAQLDALCMFRVPLCWLTLAHSGWQLGMRAA